MANPKLADGYTRIANELLEAVYSADLTRNELRVLLCIIRRTYGFNASQKALSRRFLASETGLSPARISEVMHSLKGKNIVIVKPAAGNCPQEIGIQKDYDLWGKPGTDSEPPPESVPVRNPNPTGYETRTAGGTASEPPTLYKEKEKDNTNKDSRVCASPCEASGEGIPDWFAEVWAAYPNKKGKNRISSKSYKALADAGRETVLRAVRNYRTYCEENPWYHPQNGSTFFNGGWRDYPDTPNAVPQVPEYRDILDCMEEEQNGTD